MVSRTLQLYIVSDKSLVDVNNIIKIMTDMQFSLVLSSGKDLIGVQNLLKKHQALQAEITGHEPRIKAVTQKGEAMIEEGNSCKF